MGTARALRLKQSLHTFQGDERVGAVRDLVASVDSAGNIKLKMTPLQNVATDQYEYETGLSEALSGRSDQDLPLIGDDETLPDNTLNYFRVRGRDGGARIGPWSNKTPVLLPEEVKLLLKDKKKVETAATSSITAPSAMSLTSLGLSFVAGDLLFLVLIGFRNTGTGTGTIARGTLAGWTEVQFHTGNVALNTHSVLVLMKVADGTENTLAPFVYGGGGGGQTNRAAYYALSFTILGTASAYGTPVGATTSLASVAQQITLSAASPPPLLVYSVGAVLAGAAPDQSFTPETPDINEALTGAAPNFSSQLKIRLFDVDAVMNSITTSMTDQGNLNTLLSGAIEVTV